MKRAVFFAWMLLAAVTGAAEAANFYVTASGTNGTGASWSSPWAGFDNIVWNSLAAGDTLFIDGGPNGMTYPVGLNVAASGTSANPITIAVDAGNSSHNGLVTIDPDNAGGVFGIRISGRSYVTINGYNPRHANSIGIRVQNTSANGIRVENSGSHHTLLRYIEQHSAVPEGVYYCYDGGNNTLEYCRIHDNKTQHGVLFNSGDNNTIRHCAVYNNYSSGVICYNGADYTTIQYCTLFRNGWANQDCHMHGVYLCGPSSYCTVDNCTAYENGGAGVHVFAATGLNATGNRVTNNNCYSNGNDPAYTWCGWGIVMAGFNSALTCSGNWAHGNQRFGISLWDTSAGSITWNWSWDNGDLCGGGADGDYRSSNSGGSTIDCNTYAQPTSGHPMINWLGTVYTLSTSASYQAASGKDAQATFTTSPPF